MMPVMVSLLSFCLIFGSAIVGIYLGRKLPPDQLGDDSKKVLEGSRSIIISLTAMTMGLLIYSAQTSFQAKVIELRNMAAKTVSLARVLNEYGPEAGPVRHAMRQHLIEQIDRVDSIYARGENPKTVLQSVKVDTVRVQLLGLAPKTPTQQFLKSTALDLANEIEVARWHDYERMQTDFQWPVLCMLILWLSLVFFSHGLGAPATATVTASFFLAAFASSAAILIILKLEMPFGGFISISSEPLRLALALLGVV